MKVIDVAAAIRTYDVVASGFGVPRWYVYRRAEVKGGEIPPSSLTFFSQVKARMACDALNAMAFLEAWRCG